MMLKNLDFTINCLINHYFSQEFSLTKHYFLFFLLLYIFFLNRTCIPIAIRFYTKRCDFKFCYRIVLFILFNENSASFKSVFHIKRNENIKAHAYHLNHYLSYKFGGKKLRINIT